MKKVFSLMTLLVLGACSSANHLNDHAKVSATENYKVDAEVLAEWSRPIEEEVLKRAPSNTSQRAPVVVWEADTLKFPLSAGTVIDKDFSVKFVQYSIYDTLETFRESYQRPVTNWVVGYRDVLVCPEPVSGEGQSTYWNEFYSAPKAQKAAALARAISGIGNNTSSANGSTAQNLINAGFFHKKPRSWQDFEDEIRQARQQKVISEQIEYEVLYKYRRENMENLGYSTQTSGVCRVESQRYSYPVESYETAYRDVQRWVPHRDVVGTDMRNYRIRVSGSKLQSFEKEMMVLSFDYKTNMVTVAETPFNNYSVSIAGQDVTIKGISRKNVKLPSDVLPYGATLESRAGKGYFSLPINRLYLPKKDEGRMMISFKILSCRKGTFGGCSVTRRDARAEGPFVQPVTSQLFKHDFVIQSGRKYWIEYGVNLSSSPWYINNTVKKSTSKI